MPTVWARVAASAQAASRRADEQALEALIAAVSAPADRTRERLRARRWAFIDPQGPPVSAVEVRFTAERVVTASSGRATFLGGVAGLGGLLSIPPEIAAQLVALVRLAQRLAVVYGVDPATERGRLVVWQALAAGLQVELPASGPTGLRLSDLPGVVAGRAPRDASAALTQALVRSTAWAVVGRLGRFVPVVSAGVGAVSARRTLRDAGGRMVDVLERICDAPVDTGAGVVDAIEVGGP